MVVLGTGSAASAATYKCREAGWRVAVVDSRPFGGTCALRGCDPKKVLGLREDEARAQGRKFRVHHEDTTEWYSSWRVALPFSSFKTLIAEDTGRILGAHVLGPHADEVSKLFGLAIRYGLAAKQLEDMPYAYPTSGSDAWYMV